MGFVVANVNLSITVSLTMLKLMGFWPPDDLNEQQKLLYTVYSGVVFMYILGTYIIIQVVDLSVIWGNLPLMTGTAFLLFTNMAQAIKIFNVRGKRHRIQGIIMECDEALRAEVREEGRVIVSSFNRETTVLQMTFFGITFFTLLGWATSAEKNQLPMRAWYPYDTSKSPAFEMTYCHQVSALHIAAFLNVCKDTLVTTLIAQCRCRLRLLGLSLRNLCQDMKVGYKLTPEQEAVASSRLRACVLQHQAALAAIVQLQSCFSAPTFAQFTVSLIIICVTAFQMVSQKGNLVRLISMGTYLLNMMYQVFIYCYQGHHLSEESAEIAGAAYECPWYKFSTRLRRGLLVLMCRTRRVARITAGGFTTLSLGSFMAIIKASYSLFTLLQQVTE